MLSEKDGTAFFVFRAGPAGTKGRMRGYLPRY